MLGGDDKGSGCRVTELKGGTQECENHVQVLEVVKGCQEPVTLVNVYDQKRGSERPAQKAEWGTILAGSRVVVAGDMNAHSKMWNPQARGRKNATFWEEVIENFDMVIWNPEQGTRKASVSDTVAIIDLTISTPGITLNWILLEEEATGSDHEVICWELVGREAWEGGRTERTVTGWDI